MLRIVALGLAEFDFLYDVMAAYLCTRSLGYWREIGYRCRKDFKNCLR